MFASMEDPQRVPRPRHQFPSRGGGRVGESDRRVAGRDGVGARTTSGGGDTAARASDRDLRDAAEMHRRIYQAIRAHDADAAREAMHDASDPGQPLPGAGGPRACAAADALPAAAARRASQRRARPSITH